MTTQEAVHKPAMFRCSIAPFVYKDLSSEHMYIDPELADDPLVRGLCLLGSMYTARAGDHST